MRCCVPFCVNNSEILPDIENVTFHRLPTEAVRHAAWIEALGIEKNHMQKVLFVCSLHFREADFYTTKGGQRAVQRSGIPKTEQVCIMCLDTDNKLYPLKYYNLDRAYENVTGISLILFNAILSPKVCSDCGQRLINCNTFKERSLRAHNLLLELSSKDELLRIQNLKAINRKKHKLKSNLTKNVFEPNHCDIFLVRDENNKNIKIENREKSKNVKLESREKNIKIENIVYRSEDKAEVKNESAVTVTKEEGNNNLNNEIASDEEFLHDDIDSDMFLTCGIDKVNKPTKQNNNKDIKHNSDNIDEFTNDISYKNVKLLNEGIEIDVKFSSNDYDIEFSNDNDKKIKNVNENDTSINFPIDDDVDMDFPNENDMDMDYTNESDSDIELVQEATVKCKTRTTKKCAKKVKAKVTANVNESDVSNVKVKVKKSGRKRRTPAQGRYLKRKAPTGDMEIFKVTVLTYEEQVEDIQSKKDTPLYKNSTFKCTYCYKGYQYEDTYDAHMEQHTDKYGVFECAICAIHTKSRQKLLHHLNMTHMVRYTCTKCPFYTRHRNTAKSHGRWHNGVKSKCQYCEVEFSKLTSLLSHLRKKHPSDQVCALCGYSFIGERGLALHMQKKHQFDDVQSEPGGPQCDECNIRFASETAYEQHMRVSPKHAAADNLERNEPRWHKPKAPPRYKGDQTVTCEECGMKLKGFKYYTYHFKRHHRDKIRTQFANGHERCLCELCGRVLQHRSALKSHMLVHTGRRDVQCAVCDKRFYHQRQLTIHMDTHSEPKRTFDCPVCARSFTSKSNKNRHLWTHTQVSRPFKCHACPKTFVYPSERKIHINHAHANQPYPKKSKNRVRNSRPRHMKEAVYGQIGPQCTNEASYSSETSGILHE